MVMLRNIITETVQKFLLKEFNSEHKSEVLKYGEDFTIAYELEFETENKTTNFEELSNTFNEKFKPLFDKYDLKIIPDISLKEGNFFKGLEELFLQLTLVVLIKHLNFLMIFIIYLKNKMNLFFQEKLVYI